MNLVLALILATPPHIDVPAEPRTFAFTAPSPDGGITVVIRRGKEVARLEGGYQVQQWVPAWRALALTLGSKLYAWSPGGDRPRLVADLRDGSAGPVGRGYDLLVAVGHDGRYAATTDGVRTTVIDIRSGKTAWRYGAESRIPLGFGLAWSPNGRLLATTRPGPEYLETTDGSRGSRAVVIDSRGLRAKLGAGQPVAWLSPTKVLVGIERSPDLMVHPVVYDLKTRIRTVSPMYGAAIGFDGRWVLIHSKGLIRWLDPNSLRPVAGLAVNYPTPTRATATKQNLVGIPSGAYVEPHALNRRGQILKAAGERDG